MVNKKWIFW